MNKTYVQGIREDTEQETKDGIALSTLTNKITNLDDTIRQSIETLKSQTWTDMQTMDGRVAANDARLDQLHERMHAQEKQRLQDEINRLKSKP